MIMGIGILVACAASMAGWCLSLARRGREERRLAEVDPFRVLILEERLAAAAARIRKVEDDTTMLARAHHARAALWAYDSLLREACELVGIEQVVRGAAGDVVVTDLQRALSAQDMPAHLADASTNVLGESSLRLQRELELGARGWTW